MIDVARRKGKTLADMKRLARDRTAFRQWTEDPTLQDKEEEQEEINTFWGGEKRSPLHSLPWGGLSRIPPSLPLRVTELKRDPSLAKALCMLRNYAGFFTLYSSTDIKVLTIAR